MSHFTFELPYVLFLRCRYTYFFRENDQPKNAISSTFCSYKITITATFFGCPILLLGFHTFFFAVSLYILFRLSHFTFGLPYVLFCGVVIYTFFVCPILLLGFHTFFFAVSLYIFFFVKMITRKTRFLQLFVVVKQQYDINCDSPFGHEPLGHFYIFGNKLDQTYLKFESNQRHCPKGTYLYMSNSNFIRLSHFTFKLPYVLFCGVGIHTFFGCPILLLGFHMFFCGVVIHTFFGCPILLLSFHTFFFCGVVIHTFFGKMITQKTRLLQLFVVIK